MGGGWEKEGARVPAKSNCPREGEEEKKKTGKSSGVNLKKNSGGRERLQLLSRCENHLGKPGVRGCRSGVEGTIKRKLPTHETQKKKNGFHLDGL